jgi:hypothetical protein
MLSLRICDWINWPILNWLVSKLLEFLTYVQIIRLGSKAQQFWEEKKSAEASSHLSVLRQVTCIYIEWTAQYIYIYLHTVYNGQLLVWPEFCLNVYTWLGPSQRSTLSHLWLAHQPASLCLHCICRCFRHIHRCLHNVYIYIYNIYPVCLRIHFNIYIFRSVLLTRKALKVVSIKEY